MTRFNLIQSLESRTLMSATVAPTHLGSEIHKTEPVTITVPAKPTNLTATAAGSVVTLKWTDNSTNETGFVIQRVVNGVTKNLGDFASVGSNIVTFTDTGAAAGTDIYVVRAFNTAGRSEGAVSSPVTISPHTDVVTVIAPKTLKTTTVSTSQITLTWSGDLGATGGYRIERSSSSTTGWTTAGTTAAGVRTFTDKNLTAKTKYYYRVVALGTADHSATSSPMLGVTAGGSSEHSK